MTDTNTIIVISGRNPNMAALLVHNVHVTGVSPMPNSVHYSGVHETLTVPSIRSMATGVANVALNP